MAENPNPSGEKKIIVRDNGPYRVYSGIPMVHKTQVVSKLGEPLTWKKDASFEVDPVRYSLCRCGRSQMMPICDGTHKTIPFDGSEPAGGASSGRALYTFRGGTHIVVRKDPSLCISAGFCGLAKASIAQLVANTADTSTRSLVIAMVERCPSGSLTYSIEPGEPDIEPDLPLQIADTTEILSAGPIAGPLWVTGGVRIEREDGSAFETRNRVTLCNCGQSRNKPFCDGTHRELRERRQV
jgi:CDGSH-type Zn-finger protein